MGIPWHQHMVPGPIQGPLSMQFVLCSRNKSVPYIRVGGTLPAALPTPEPKPGRASESTHGRVTNRNNCCGGDHKRKGPPQIATHSPRRINLATTSNGSPKGGRQPTTCPTACKDGISKGDRQSSHYASARPNGQEEPRPNGAFTLTPDTE
jgi:hypothetical protein